MKTLFYLMGCYSGWSMLITSTNHPNTLTRGPVNTVAIFFGKTFLCSGAKYSENVVLSTATCFTWVPDVNETSVLMDTLTKNVNENEYFETISFPVKQVHSFPGYRLFDKHTKNDLAAVFLNRDGNPTPVIQLPSFGFRSELHVTVFGWGYLTEIEPQDQLQYLNMTLIDYATCRKQTHKLVSIDPISELCIKPLVNKYELEAFGNTGSPVFFGTTLVGLISWAQTNEIDLAPTVLTNITTFTDWIKSTINEGPLE